MPLGQYQKKRDFTRTPEPPPRKKARKGALTFVVQKHAARRLHYDLRLELDGVLKSWALPKGPSQDPKEKHLAVMVEDHPLDYGSFEGVIPEGQYGAGRVIVWDRGTYGPAENGEALFDDRSVAEAEVRRGLKEGKLSFFLRGHKLYGSWTLVKLARGDKNWLLIRHRADEADPPSEVIASDRSVQSGLSLDALKLGSRPESRGRALGPEDLRGARRAPFPPALAPMLATPTDKPFSHRDWLFEPKLDGVRTLALLREGKARLSSRRGLNVSRQYPSLVHDLERKSGREMVLDGEIVALNERGRPSFERLQERLNLTREEDLRRAEQRIPLVYYVFDLLYLDGYDLTRAPLEERKALLAVVLVPSERVRLLEDFETEGEAAYEAAIALGLEGMVAKRKDSHYEPGKRSRHWLKVKATLSEDFFVGGYTRGEGGRANTLGALLLGSYDAQDRLHYSGQVGSGFDERTLVKLKRRLDSLRSEQSPFSGLPPKRPRAWGRPTKRVETTWVRPEVVVEVKYAERTRDGLLRAPVFLRLREDKAPAERSRVNLVPLTEGAVFTRGSERSLSDDIRPILEQLSQRGEKALLLVQGFELPVSNLGKALWPAKDGRVALTKRDLLLYLARVAPYLLAHMKDRPLTLTRYPDGIFGERFYQKHWETPLPEFLETTRPSSSESDPDQDFLLCNNLTTLLWLGQIADLELHTALARVSAQPDAEHLLSGFSKSKEYVRRSLLNWPDFIVCDLDPYLYSGREKEGEEPELNREGFERTCQAALWLKELLDGLSLAAFVKTSGKTGLHVFVPILRQFDYDTTRRMAEAIGRVLVRQHPKEITMEWAIEKRRGKVFFDHNQNAYGKSMAGVYSPRPLPEATISMPLGWDELGKVFPTDFSLVSAPERLQATGDLWSGILEAKRDLRSLLELSGERKA